MPRWGRRARPRVLVIGLDCASPNLVFDTFQPDLPHLRQLMAVGRWGVLRSCVPCITVPAWSSMFTSRDPGVLGIYGFRNRSSRSYAELASADSRAVQRPRVWERVGAAGQQVIVANVPQTYPVTPVRGLLISDFTTPSPQHQFTHPPTLRAEVLRRHPEYRFDISDFRTDDKAALEARLYDVIEAQYQTFDHLLATEDWRLAIHVNMGLDRVQHGFWRFHDPQHRRFEQNRFSTVIRDYYRWVDSWIGRLLRHVDGETSVLVVSDHGVKRMDGAVALNEWLRLHGWLCLKEPLPAGITRFDPALVDWSRTRAWSTGGYYGRIFLNVQGREPQGVVPAAAVDDTLNELVERLQTLRDDRGQPLAVCAMRPRDLYQEVNGIAPDLIVYFGDLHWRTVGGLGYSQPLTLDNDTGPDDANHAEEGMYLWVPAGGTQGGRGEERQLMDIAPTILEALRLPPDPAHQGRSLFTLA
jgi:predicted AlkP superfamily phosphohydrolase/phosphomutase